MDCYIGIDLGSTTTKAVFLAEDTKILGKGITNSRSNYELACEVAREEAEINSRFFLLEEKVKADPHIGKLADDLMAWLESKFSLSQHQKQLAALQRECLEVLAAWPKAGAERERYHQAVGDIMKNLYVAAEEAFVPGGKLRSTFFRDLAASLFLKQAELVAKEMALSFDKLIGIFDKAIIRVENQSFAVFYEEYLKFACAETVKLPQFKPYESDIARSVYEIIHVQFNVINMVGTGYGRLSLPFPKRQIRSEILCHGLGAHYFFPNTRTVLDIGGQDTKAIQVDAEGVVTSFQMNDRCAAGCGRYLGYIADEMNIGVHQLGPLAATAKRPARINSTCTVFAGAEVRERLALGERREDILAGLHRAIILRAMSLLARSGGIFSEFTFTGGVARNMAATNILKQLIIENYGEVKINISHDSIFTGAVGAALFARQEATAKA